MMGDHGASLRDRAGGLRPEPATLSQPKALIPSALEGEILAARSTDAEAAALLSELAKLQMWCVMQARHDPGAIAAADLVQRTRILIIERCKR